MQKMVFFETAPNHVLFQIVSTEVTNFPLKIDRKTNKNGNWMNFSFCFRNYVGLTSTNDLTTVSDKQTMMWLLSTPTLLHPHTGMRIFPVRHDFLIFAIIFGHPWDQFKFTKNSKGGWLSWTLNKIQDVDFRLITKIYFHIFSCSGILIPHYRGVWGLIYPLKNNNFSCQFSYCHQLSVNYTSLQFLASRGFRDYIQLGCKIYCSCMCMA